MFDFQAMSCTLSSADEFSTALDGSGWEADFRQLNRGCESVELAMAATSSMTLLRVDIANAVHQQALPPPGTVTFGLPIRPQAVGRIGQQVLESETLTLFDPRQGLDVVSAPHFGAYTFSLDIRRLSELPDSFELPDLTCSNAPLGIPRKLSPQQLLQMRQPLRQFFCLLEQGEMKSIGAALREIESDLSLTILRSWFASESTPGVSANNRSRALRRALEYIRSRQKLPISVRELCCESACSISTLERAFREHLGVSPKQYLTSVRLGGVRRALLNPLDKRGVADVATEWGFWHLSKFASDYRMMFGELPSMTGLNCSTTGEPVLSRHRQSDEPRPV